MSPVKAPLERLSSHRILPLLVNMLVTERDAMQHASRGPDSSA
jgi:hypothetical protein